MSHLNFKGLWVLKSKGENSAFRGNEGYPDLPSSHYVYDTNVKNHDKISTGDFVIIVDKKCILGYAIVTSIDKRKDVAKKRYRCPICGIQEYYERELMRPRYRCRNKDEFDVPKEEDIIVDEFTARYKSTFIAAKPNTRVQILENYYIKRNKYYSIQRADTSFISKMLPNQNQILRFMEMLTCEPDKSFEIPDVDEYEPMDGDERERKNASVVVRKWQRKFRNDLIRIYGSYCMITGPNNPIVLDASHICPYRGKRDNHLSNGLLLRSDLHKLFDSDLLGVNPNTLEIKLHPLIKDSYYQRYEGEEISIPREDFRPSIKALTLRWKRFNSE